LRLNLRQKDEFKNNNKLKEMKTLQKELKQTRNFRQTKNFHNLKSKKMNSPAKNKTHSAPSRLVVIKIANPYSSLMQHSLNYKKLEGKKELNK
jgi:hypothetical protein